MEMSVIYSIMAFIYCIAGAIAWYHSMKTLRRALRIQQDAAHVLDEATALYDKFTQVTVK